MSGDVVLATRNLGVDLSGREILVDVSLEARRGEITTLVGPNGAGKTTLLRAMLGLVRPRSGTVEIDGADAGRGRRARGKIGYVPQRHEFAWEFPTSVREVVMSGRTGRIGLFRRPRVADWRIVGESLALVRMGEFADRPIAELSGGQRQRVLVARALALGSSTLVLDEPFTGLDMPTQELLTELFRELAAGDRAVLMTSHDLVQAVHAADRLVILADGRVVAAGTPDELRDPDPWVRAFAVSPDSPLVRSIRAV